MSQRNARTLQAFVSRVLTWRAAIASGAVALVLGTFAYFLRPETPSSDVIAKELTVVEYLRNQLLTGMAGHGATINGLMTQLQVTEQARTNSLLVIVRVLSPAGQVLGEALGSDPMLVLPGRQLLDRSPTTTGELLGVEWSVVSLADRPCLYSRCRLIGGSGQADATLEAVFLLSPAAREHASREALGSAIRVGALSFVAMWVFYAVLLLFVRRLTVFAEVLLEANIELAKVLGGAIAKRDSDTDAHNFRVTIYAVRLGEAAHLSDFAIQALIKGAFLHDVGKVGIRDEVLLKPGKLDEGEFEHIKTHVQHGLDIVSRSPWLRDSLRVVANHHEWFDGTGYPMRVAGEVIPIEARVFAIVDVFDALTSKRPHKGPMSFDESIAVLTQGRGRHFDPVLLDTFVSIARPLFDRLSDCEDELLRNELKEIVETYFTRGISTLDY